MTLRHIFDLLLYFTAGFYWSDEFMASMVKQVPADDPDRRFWPVVGIMVFALWPIYVVFLMVAVPMSGLQELRRKRRDQ